MAERAGRWDFDNATASHFDHPSPKSDIFVDASWEGPPEQLPTGGVRRASACLVYQNGRHRQALKRADGPTNGGATIWRGFFGDDAVLPRWPECTLRTEMLRRQGKRAMAE